MDKQKLIRITTVPISLYSLLKGQLAFMSKYYNVIGVSSNGDLIESVKRQEGVPIRTVEMVRTISPLKDLKAVWSLYKLFKKEKPLIVHTHTPKAGTVGMLAAKLAGVPLRLHTIAGLPLLEEKGNKRNLLNWVEKATYACATNIYPNSYGLREIILQEGFCDDTKLRVLGAGSSNGINTSYFSSSHFSEEQKFSCRADLKIQPDDFVFIFVGRLVGDKGMNELVEAFRMLSIDEVKVKLLLVGSLENELDPLALKTTEEINRNRNIISVGFKNDVRSYFAIADTLVFPSYREGFPNVVMQAGAMGLPSIVTDINGCNEIIKENVNGLIIPVKDTNAVYNAMKKMMKENSFRHVLQQNARELITSRYEQRVVWEAILQEYKQLEEIADKN